MRHKKTVIGLIAALTLASMSTASAQSPTTTPPFSSKFRLFLPGAVQPGATIELSLAGPFFDSSCGGSATSPGFVAPIFLPRRSQSGLFGSGQVIKKPGDYVASVPCTDGSTVTAQFKIVGSNPSPPPPTRVTPIGPPQTGGGGTARSVA